MKLTPIIKTRMILWWVRFKAWRTGKLPTNPNKPDLGQWGSVATTERTAPTASRREPDRFRYSIKSHPTKYSGVLFRSRLEARWAAFFDLAGWTWQYEPLDLFGWTPDFRVEFPCGHSECGASHVLLAEVKPYFSLAEFGGHRCQDFDMGGQPTSEGGKGEIPADAAAAFGNDPSVTRWEMCHGAGAGVYSIDDWVSGDVDAMWKEAGNRTQWQPQRG